MRDELEILNDLCQNGILKRNAVINQMYESASKYRDIEKKLSDELLEYLNVNRVKGKTYGGLEDYYEGYGFGFPSIELIRQIKLGKILGNDL